MALTNLDSWALLMFHALKWWMIFFFFKGKPLQVIEVLRKERQYCWFSLLETASLKVLLILLISFQQLTFLWKFRVLLFLCGFYFFTKDYTGLVSLNYEVYGKHVFWNLSEYLSWGGIRTPKKGVILCLLEREQKIIHHNFIYVYNIILFLPPLLIHSWVR